MDEDVVELDVEVEVEVDVEVEEEVVDEEVGWPPLETQTPPEQLFDKHSEFWIHV